MSQTSRSRIIAAQRHRRGLARAIAELELDASVVTPGHDLDTLPRESVLRQPRKRTWPS